MKPNKFIQVLDAVIARGHLDCEDVRYQPKKFGFSEWEFWDVVDYLDKNIPKEYEVYEEDPFPDTQKFFFWKSPNSLFPNNFIVRILSGQGTVSQIYLSEEEYERYEIL